MKKARVISDKLAIGLSVMCAFHCLALPSLLVLLPSITALQLNNEAFHIWMLIAVLPISAYALRLGCKEHQRYKVFCLGMIGLTLLVMAVVLGELLIGELGEKLFTLFGACLVAACHFWNYRLCQQSKDCSCPSSV